MKPLARSCPLRAFCYNFQTVKDRKKTTKDRPIFDSLRKPTAPATRKIGTDKAEEKVHPSLRKVKHKVKTEPED